MSGTPSWLASVATPGQPWALTVPGSCGHASPATTPSPSVLTGGAPSSQASPVPSPGVESVWSVFGTSGQLSSSSSTLSPSRSARTEPTAASAFDAATADRDVRRGTPHGAHDRGLDLRRTQRRVAGEQQRGDAGDVRRGHRRAVHVLVAAGVRRRVDVLAGRVDVDRRRPVVRERGAPVAGVVCADADHVRRLNEHGYTGELSLLRPLLPAATTNSVSGMLVDRLLLERRERGAAEARVDHAHALVAGELERVDDVREEAVAVGVEHPQRQDPRLGRHAGHADPVVDLRGDRAGHVGAVTVRVVRDLVLVDPVVSGGHAAGEVRMCGQDAGVDGGDRAPVAEAHAPRLGGVDVDVGQRPIGAARRTGDELPGVLEAPQPREVRVVRERVDDTVLLGDGDAGIAAQVAEGRPEVVVIDGDHLGAGHLQGVDERRVDVRADLRLLARREPRLVLDDDPRRRLIGPCSRRQEQHHEHE